MRNPPEPGGPRPRDEGRAALLGLLAVQLFLGYEWLMSGLSKLLKPGFINALREDLVFRSRAATAWYRALLDGIAIPNSEIVGTVIVIGELFLGAALMTAAVLWAIRWSRFSTAGRSVILVTIIAAGVIAVVANVNYHFYTAASHPWFIAADPFQEGVDLDSLMPVVQVVLSLVALRYLIVLRGVVKAMHASRPLVARG